MTAHSASAGRAKTVHPTPNLVTAQNGPLLELERRSLDSRPAIERRFRHQWQDHTPAFYGSVDLRNAGLKLAPVDMNLFPGGFDNLSEEMLPSAVQAARAAIRFYSYGVVARLAQKTNP